MVQGNESTEAESSRVAAAPKMRRSNSNLAY